jgi:ferrous iron transport protein B
MTLDDLSNGQKGLITKVRGRGVFRKRILEMGFVPGKEVEVIRSAPLKDPVEFKILDSFVSLRRAEANLIEVIVEGDPSYESLKTSSSETHKKHHHQHFHHQLSEDKYGENKHLHKQKVRLPKQLASSLDLALVGNPNCGKTSLFNLASNSREHTGNYSGVTVDSKEADLDFEGYRIKMTDLPGTYSLSSVSPDEKFVINHLLTGQPDVVVNVIDASNLERNLYLTTQLIDMDLPVVIALNMYDEFSGKGNHLDYKYLGKLLGIPVIPTVGITGKGVDKLLKKVIEVGERREKTVRHIHIQYNPEIEISIKRLQDRLWKLPDFSDRISSRFISIKLLERNWDLLSFVSSSPEIDSLKSLAEHEIARIEKLYKDDIETLITDSRFGFIAGALKETLTSPKPSTGEISPTHRLDGLLTHKWLGFPIFLLFLWIMFQATFNLGRLPVGWIEQGVSSLSVWLDSRLPESILKDLLVDGIVSGVGGVLAFLPNILILFLFISFMEDTGYMARVAFIMDKLMHLIGLHGKSFIPLIMGFGCNVPAIMATRTIENRGDRLMTMLILPLMSCSARLPVYILIAGIVFPDQAANTIFLLYLTGVVLSILMALIFKSTLFRKKENPFVMELPPYRPPRLKAIGKHMWFRSQMYLKKMGGVILIASMIIWALGYFPRTEGTRTQQLEASAIGHIGRTIQPALAPLGFDWKMSVALLSGVTAKEVVVSTIGVLYQDDNNDKSLQDRISEARHTQGKLTGKPVFTPGAAMAFMLFVLIYVPCIAVLAAIKKESGSWKWALFTIVYMTTLAWIVAKAGYFIMSLIS